MPDLSIEYYWLCDTARDWSTTKNGHTITWGYRPRGDVQYDWHCDCKGFQFRRACKHVSEAKQERCGWHQWADGGDCDGKQCPRCSGPVTSERWAV